MADDFGLQLEVDPEREDLGTGMFVRAHKVDGWVNADVSTLTRRSLINWLESRPDPWAKNVVLQLLGHRPILRGEVEDDAG